MASLTLLQILITMFAAFAGSTVLTSIGFGIGMVAIPILLLALDPATAVVVLNTVTVPLLLLIVYKDRKYLRIREMLPIALVGLVGALVGAFVLANSAERILRIIIVVLIILLTVATAFNLQRPLPKPQILGPVAGFLSGLMLGALAIGGPLLVLFILTRNWTRHEIRVSIPFYFLFIMSTAVFGYMGNGLYGEEQVILSAFAIGPILLGFLAGNWLAQRMNDQIFRRAAIIVIIATSLVVLTRELTQI